MYLPVLRGGLLPVCRGVATTGDHSKYLVGPTVHTKTYLVPGIHLPIFTDKFGPIYDGPPY